MTAYGGLEKVDLADFLAQWSGLQREALTGLGKDRRIHPSAYVHPTAITGDDVIIGPDVKVHEFSTVRKGSVLCAGAQVGFNSGSDLLLYRSADEREVVKASDAEHGVVTEIWVSDSV
ncbi:hypothetical protein [Streptomyces sp. NPDC002054]|uniref:hypothetical protein n=1 Tax=Streptomyces sp. NPDC002054 TaxID=3154663 RepID=UPI00332D3849